MLHIHFYYELAIQNQNVELVIEGMGHNLIMMSYPKMNKHYYFFDLLLNDSFGYPITLNYKYCLQNGTILDTKTVTLTHKSIVDYIVIKDYTFKSIISNTSLPTTNSSIDALFFLEIPPPLSSSTTSVLIRSPFPQLSGQLSTGMMYLKEHNLWVTKISIDTSFPMPFLYYYSIKTTQNLFYGENRLRIIEFNSPLNRNFTVSCYDYFFANNQPGNVTFRFKPIEISTFQNGKSQLFETDFTRFELLFLPEESEKNKIGEIGVVMNSSNSITAKLSKLSKHQYWIGNLELPNDFPMSTYSLRISPQQTARIENLPLTYNSPINFLMTINNTSFSNIQTKILKSEVKLNRIILYFQLVSLKTENFGLNICGTFGTIGEFSNFLKKTEISAIHLHIEKVPGSELFLDPVQLDFSEPVVMNFLRALIENPEVMKVDATLLSQIELIVNQSITDNLNLNVLREIKTLIVKKDYKMYKNFNAFESFKTVFANFFKSQIQLTDFEYYVQFVCYCQLFTNIQKAHLNGIQIITDFSVADGILSAIDALPVISLYSSAVYLNDISNIEESGFTIAQIKEKFRDDATFVSSTFCEKRGAFYCIKPEFKIPKEKKIASNTSNPQNYGPDLISFGDSSSSSNTSLSSSQIPFCSLDMDKLNSALLFIDVTVRQYYMKSLIELNQIEEAKSSSSFVSNDRKSATDDIFNRLIGASKFIASTLIVDEKTSFERNPAFLEQNFILSSFSSSSQSSFPRSYLVPDGLSPLRTSSFLSNASKSKVAEAVKNTLKKSSAFTVVYLSDFLFCVDLASLTGHSVVTGNDPDRRDVLHVTVKDLMANVENSAKKINEFLHSF